MMRAGWNRPTSHASSSTTRPGVQARKLSSPTDHIGTIGAAGNASTRAEQCQHAIALHLRQIPGRHGQAFDVQEIAATIIVGRREGIGCHHPEPGSDVCLGNITILGRNWRDDARTRFLRESFPTQPAPWPAQALAQARQPAPHHRPGRPARPRASWRNTVPITTRGIARPRIAQPPAEIEVVLPSTPNSGARQCPLAVHRVCVGASRRSPVVQRWHPIAAGSWPASRSTPATAARVCGG